MTKYFIMTVVIFFTLTGCGNNPMEGTTKPEISLMDAVLKGKVEIIQPVSYTHLTLPTIVDV